MQKGSDRLSLICTGLILASLFLCPFLGSSQGLINNGAKIVITENSNIYVDGATGHFTNQPDGLVTNNTPGGKIIVGGNWVNNAVNAVFSNEGATVVFNGSAAQSIGGTNGTGFYNISASGTGIKTFDFASTVSRLVSVDGSELNANGKLILTAEPSSHASIGQLLNGASVTNNVIVQSYFTGENSLYRAHKGVSSPINDALVVGDKTYKQLQSKVIITGPGGTANGFDKGNSIAPEAITIKTYNEAAHISSSQFTNLDNITKPTTPGLGFFLFYRGDRINNYDASGTSATGAKIEGTTYSTPESVIAEYTGPVNQGTVEVDLSYTDNGDGDIYIGSNLVGNPYPSVIDWHAVKAASTNGGANISPNIYVIKQDGSFAVYNSDQQDSVDGGTRYIMSGQAFYVKADAAFQKLIFTESCKEPYPTLKPVMRFLSAPSAGKGLMGTSAVFNKTPSNALRLTLKNGDTSAETLIRFIDDASDAYDSKDAVYFSGSTLTLCSRSADNKLLSMNYLPEPQQSAEIKLYVASAQSGKLSLNFSGLQTIAGFQIFLRDTYLNKLENINTISAYEFETDRKVSKSYGSDRFKLIFRPMVTLPTLSARKIYGGSEITWTGLNTLTNNMFSVERSGDGKSFTPIGIIQKEDLSAIYNFLDNKPETGTNYYRLKLLENDDLYSYTNTVSLDYAVDAKEPNFKIFPNPVKDALNVTFKEESKNVMLTVYNLNGQEYKNISMSNTNKASLNLADLNPGVYFLRAVDGANKELGTEKFIKE